MNSKNCEFVGGLGRYKIIETEDKSMTLWSEHFDENCHSLAGAIEETDHNYVAPTKVKERSISFDDFTVVEVGFGLGTGVNTTLRAIDKLEGSRIRFFSLELDEGLVKWAIDNNSETFERMPSLSDLKRQMIGNIICYRAENNNAQITIACGNARETLPVLVNAGEISNVHAFYQDPFSPKKNPILWTVEWFKDLKRASHPLAILSTYSASSSVKKALYEAGWIPSHRKGFKGKRQSISATLEGEISQDMRDHLNRSPVEPFRD